MPNIASILKLEIARVARKELRAQMESARKAAGQQRSQIASLKRSVAALEKKVKLFAKSANSGRGSMRARPLSVSEDLSQDDGKQRRFSAKRLAAHRAKIGISAEDYGRLCGASGQSVYKWETEKARPRERQLLALAAVRGISRRQALERLEALDRKR